MAPKILLPSYLQKFSLEGKTAILTGGTGGIGLGIVAALAEAGANVISLQLPTEPEDAKEIIEKFGQKCFIIHCNLLNPESLPKVVEEAFQICLPDILINCAGIFKAGPTVDFDTASMERLMTLNATAGMVLARECTKRWLDLCNGDCSGKKIVNFASTSSFQGNIETMAYSASKGAVLLMTRAMSNEWAPHGICVNSIAPGYTKSFMTKHLYEDEEYNKALLPKIPRRRWGQGEDIASTLIYLVSAASDYVTGTCAVVDGGILA